MAAKLYIISGFLGAGKTTLIQKLLREALQGKKVALIENDFGEIGIDAALLRATGVEVKEMNAGCICCSLVGDFLKAMEMLVKRFQPEIIIIEPSGVGKLSDIDTACRDRRLRGMIELEKKITVVDVKRAPSYAKNFGAFFRDQIRHADTVVLSRCEKAPEKVAAAVALVHSLHPGVALIAEPWQDIDAAQLLLGMESRAKERAAVPVRHRGGGKAFSTVTLYTERRFTPAELKAAARRLGALSPGTVLRAKGILRGEEGHILFQYLPKELKLEKTAASGNTLTFIGKDLDRAVLSKIFLGE